jgi:hypothetical protein
MSFVSNADEITILPQWNNRFYYISGKINDRYLTVFKKDSIEPVYDLYLLDLSNSPDFDTTNAEKVYFDFPAAPYEIYHISDSLYIAGVDSLPYGGYRIYLLNFDGETFHFIDKITGSLYHDWIYRNGYLYAYEYPDLVRYSFNPADTSFVNRTVIITGGGITTNDDFTFATKILGDTLFIYNIGMGQLINTVDISSLNHPEEILIDSPYVYIHQTTYVTDVTEEPNKVLSYKLQVYPNPFNPVTNIVYTLPERAMAEVKMYDVLGREVKEIFNGEAEAGEHTQLIDGRSLSSGVYFIRFTAAKYADTKKVLLLK